MRPLGLMGATGSPSTGAVAGGAAGLGPWAEAWGAVAAAAGRDDLDDVAAGVWAGLEAAGRGGRLALADAAGGG